jgi:chromosome partitioning protein
MIILICGSKGGGGKTTIATNLAASRAAQGRAVLLVNADPNGTSSIWAARRAESGTMPAITCVSMFGKGMAAEVTKMAPRFDDILIDCVGADSAEQRQGMLVADVMVIPCRASQFDLDVLALVNRTVAESRHVNPTARALLVVNAASTHAAGTDPQKVANAVVGLESLTLSDAVLCERQVYRDAGGMGLGAAEVVPRNVKAAREVSILHHAVFGEPHGQ